MDRLIESIRPAIGIEQAAGAGEEDDLVRLQLLHQFVGGEVGVDVEDLVSLGVSPSEVMTGRAGAFAAGPDRRQVVRFISPTSP